MPGENPPTTVDPPSVDITKQIFFHQFTFFRQRFGNDTKGLDYYERNFLNPDGEGDEDYPEGKYRRFGGYIRDMPEAKPVSTNTVDNAWIIDDFLDEIQDMVDAGATGAALNILDARVSAGGDRNNWNNMMRFYEAVDLYNASRGAGIPKFNTLPMFDMDTNSGSDQSLLVPCLMFLEDTFDSLYKIDGKIIIPPYAVENWSINLWNTKLTELANAGYDCMLWGVMKGWKGKLDSWIGESNGQALVTKWVYGVSDWGDRTAEFASTRLDANPAAVARNTYGVKWMGPFAPQDFRPRSKNFQEGEGFKLILDQLKRGIIEQESDMAHGITWNDWPEGAGMTRSQRSGTNWMEIVRYHADWYKTGVEPTITEDVLYSGHRPHHTNDQIDGSIQALQSNITPGHATAYNKLQALVFLTAPADVVITFEGSTQTEAVPAGMHLIEAPFPENTYGNPVMKIIRGGVVVKSLLSHKIRKNSWQDDYGIYISKAVNGDTAFTLGTDLATVGISEINTNSSQTFRQLTIDSAKTYLVEMIIVVPEDEASNSRGLKIDTQTTDSAVFKYVGRYQHTVTGSTFVRLSSTSAGFTGIATMSVQEVLT